MKKNNFITLGIETSCDETACAVLKGSDQILSSVVASSLKLHKRFGGVVPEIASRHCLEYVQLVFTEALRQAKIKSSDIDLIGVTQGPGLVGSLLVGLTFAKGLSYRLKVPLIGVNHLEGHLFVNFLGQSGLAESPFVGLVISGGHTSIVYCRRKKIELLGETRDDAVGEAFDKVAKILDLGYPGGPVIERTARLGDENKIHFKCADFPGTYDFSFSGIKTGVLYYARKSKNLKAETPDICAGFQKTVSRVLIKKTLQAAKEKGVKTVVVGGGVSANQYLKQKLERKAEALEIRVIFPPIRYAMDNAAMIARRAYDLSLGYKKPPSRATLAANPALAFA